MTLDEVKQLGGTYYIEIFAGYFGITSNRWNSESLFFQVDIWLKVFEGIAQDTLEDYDFHEFTDTIVNQSEVFILKQKLLQIAHLFETINKIEDLHQESLCSTKTHLPYLNLDDGLLNPFWSDKRKADTEHFNREHFKNIIKITINSYRQLAQWLDDNCKNSMSISGV